MFFEPQHEFFLPSDCYSPFIRTQCCALYASKYAPSYSHSSWYWAAVRRVICWLALSSYGQFINSSKTRCEMMFRFRFKIHFIIVFVLCLGGGIGEISSLCGSFLCQMLCIFAVFERQVNKCTPVATTSRPKYFRLAPRFSRAVT